MRAPPIPLPETGSAPRLAFTVEGAEAVRFAAAPTIAFRLRIDSDIPVRSLMLTAQIRLEVTRRGYDATAEDRLVELFGERSRWGQTLRSLLWTHVTFVVTPFSGTTTVEVPVPCTYDFEVASTKYFNALEDGDVPIEMLFSGTVFYTSEEGLLRTAQISWEHEAAFALPIAVWKEAIDSHFPGSAWLRMHRDVFDRLYAYRATHALPSWESTVEHLLEGKE